MPVVRIPGTVVAVAFLLALLAACSLPEEVLPLDPAESRVALVVEVEGPGRVAIEGADADCSSTCTVEVEAGTLLELRPLPGEGATFVGWNGPCSGTGSCTLEAESDLRIEASFSGSNAPPTDDDSPPTDDGASGGDTGDGGTVPDDDRPADDDGASDDEPSNAGPGADGVYLLEIDPAGTGSGHVEVPTSDFVCTFRCDMEIIPGETEELVAVPGEGSFFHGWGGACEGRTGATCTLTVDQDMRVFAYFRPEDEPIALQVDPVPSGGTIVGAEIDCGDDGDQCASSHVNGDEVVLEAVPSRHFEFVEWTGECASSGTSTCTVEMNGDARVSARFRTDEELFVLTVRPRGNGVGEIIFPDGERCDETSTCDQRFPAGDEVTLTVEEADGSYLNDWDYEGCDYIENNCTINMDRNITIEPSFVTKELAFLLRIVEPVGGTIANDKMACGDEGDNCERYEQFESTMSFEAIPSEGYEFVSWEGDCSDYEGPVCELLFRDDKEIGAVFRPE